MRYEEMYLPVSVEYLRELYALNSSEIALLQTKYYGISKVINEIPQVCNAICISYFISYRFNSFPQQHPVNLDKFKSSYHERLLRNLDWFRDHIDHNIWKIRAYLCPWAITQTDILERLLECDFVEVVIMKNETVGHSPGALWRLLAMSDTLLNNALIADIDEYWDSEKILKYFPKIAQYDKALSRLHHLPRERFWLRTDGSAYNAVSDGSAKNYPTILASRIYVQPRRLNIPDIDILMSSYAWLRQKRSTTDKPWSQISDDEVSTPYNKGFRHDIYGAGNHWLWYCFDERFLKHVIFPWVVERGELCTYINPQDHTSDLQMYLNRYALNDLIADLEYVHRRPTNVTINNFRKVEWKF